MYCSPPRAKPCEFFDNYYDINNNRIKYADHSVISLYTYDKDNHEIEMFQMEARNKKKQFGSRSVYENGMLIKLMYLDFIDGKERIYQEKDYKYDSPNFLKEEIYNIYAHRDVPHPYHHTEITTYTNDERGNSPCQ